MGIGTKSWTRFGIALVMAAGIWGKVPAPVDGSAAHAAEPESRLEIAVGEGDLIRLPRPAISVFVANPEVADIQVPSPNNIFLLGRKAGTTTLYAVDSGDRQVLRRTIVVRHNTAEILDLLHQRFPDHRFSLASAPGSLMLGGTVDNAATLKSVTDTLAPFLAKDEKLVNTVVVKAPTQVHLRVRIAEVSRQITQKFGVNWQALLSRGNWGAGIMNGRDFLDDAGVWQIPDAEAGWGIRGGFHAGSASIEAVIDVLDREGLVSVMAEPNLTAVSGQTASFLAGGEFPIPVVQSGASNSISVTFKPFGVALDFTPTVLSSDRISLNVRPEVSSLTLANGIELNNWTIQGLNVRRMETTVELASGQSFAIGGLLQENMSDTAARVPGLGNLPVLGKLFSSQDYQNNKTELVVIVTVYTVKPTESDMLRTPLQSLKPASDVEYITLQRTGDDPLAAETPRLMGPAGFVY
jgi:Flp pilus assembly protein, secretin CpaC